MLGRTHQIVGITTGVAAFLVLSPTTYNPATFAAVLVGAHLASLLPDIDQPGASFWKAFPFGHAVGHTVQPFMEHRNFTHSLIGGFCFAYVLALGISHFPAYWGINADLLFWCVLAAFASHLLADGLTEEGIPLLFPIQHNFGFPPKPFDGLRLVTGKWFETLVLFPCFNLAFIALLYFKWDDIRRILFK